MKGPLFRILLSMTVTLSGIPGPIQACGGGPIIPLFEFLNRADLPLGRYAAGELGIVTGSLSTEFLVVAYRHLKGLPAGGRDPELIDLLGKGLSMGNSDLLDRNGEILGDAVQEWLSTRARVPDLPQLSTIATHARIEHQYYLNCTADAFRYASQRLRDFLVRYGPRDPDLFDWVATQDMVFSNCGAKEQIPPALAPDRPAEWQQERLYQIGAAYFYRGDFAAADESFSRLESDPESPFQARAAYLRARNAYRASSLLAGPGEIDAVQIARAEEKAEEILQESIPSPFQAATLQLLSLIRFRSRPGEQADTAAGQLELANPENLVRTIGDYSLHFFQSEREGNDRPELTRWIEALRAWNRAPVPIEEWRRTGSAVWLIPLIARTSASSEWREEVLTAASEVPREWPGSMTATYQRGRLLVELGRLTEAESLLRPLAASEQLPPTARNRLKRLLVRTAPDLSDLAFRLLRQPVAVSQNSVMLAPEWATRWHDRGPWLQYGAATWLDHDGARFLNEALPISRAPELLVENRFPAEVEKEIVLSSWVKALLLQDLPIVRELTPRVTGYYSHLETETEAWMQEQDPTRRSYLAALMLLRNPGLSPFTRWGFPRTAHLEKLQILRDNWWANWDSPEEADAPSLPLYLSDGEKKAAELQAAFLRNLPAGPSYLADSIVAWGAGHIMEPDLPEALHLSVRATRYGRGDERNSEVSRRSFQLLHRIAPGSEWARRTPYWF